MVLTSYPLGGRASSGRVVAADRQGSERLVLSTSGAALGTREYDAYGNIRSQTGTSVPFDYTGNRRDAESGLIYLRARLYDPATGRFLSRDPAGDCPSTPLSAHAYLYGLANPARYTDPLGLSSWDGPAPSTMPADYPGAQPYLGIGKPPVPQVAIGSALDDGICSVNEPDLCLETIWELDQQNPGAGYMDKYVPNNKQFGFGRNSPFKWWPSPCTICKKLVEAGYVFGWGVTGGLLCAAAGFSGPVAGALCGGIASVIIMIAPPPSKSAKQVCEGALFCR